MLSSRLPCSHHKCCQGRRGVQGINGTPGTNGVPGTNGTPGIPGGDGSPGLPGVQGDQGEQGVLGSPGQWRIDSFLGAQGIGILIGPVLSWSTLNLTDTSVNDGWSLVLDGGGDLDHFVVPNTGKYVIHTHTTVRFGNVVSGSDEYRFRVTTAPPAGSQTVIPGSEYDAANNSAGFGSLYQQSVTFIADLTDDEEVRFQFITDATAMGTLVLGASVFTAYRIGP